MTPLPFLYEATGEETTFTNGLDPDPPLPRACYPGLLPGELPSGTATMLGRLR